MGTISLNLSIQLTGDYINVSKNPVPVTTTWIDEKQYSQTETQTSTWKAISKGDDITGLGIAVFRNVGDNPILMSVDSGTTTQFIIYSGEFMPIRFDENMDISKVVTKSDLGSVLFYEIYSV